jgi:hypothetical protein
MKITLSEKVLDSLRRVADQSGITPNILARIYLNQLHGSDDNKHHLVRLENWREIEAYVKVRGFRDIGTFLGITAEGYMKKNHLSAAQKAKIDTNIEK